jgi:hypothetical protein
MAVLRKVNGKEGRVRFLYHIPWMLLRCEMSWDRWGEFHGNLDKCERYFQEDPCWFRAFQVWRLIHQMAAYTAHPELIRERKRWLARVQELDEGELSDRDAAGKLVTGVQAGLSAGELKRLKKLCVQKPNWKFNPEALKVARQVNARLGR